MPPSTNRSARLESIAFYVLLITTVLSPLVFWPSQYFAIEAVKTIVIAIGTLVSAGLYAFLAVKSREAHLPPRSMVWIGVAMVASVFVSAVMSGHFLKSFFGQGFELGAGSFVLLLFVVALVTYRAVAKRPDRAIVIYAGLVGAFLVLWIFQALRLVIGPGFASLGILNSLTSTVLGNWFTLAMYALVIILISISALVFLPLSPRMKAAYWVLIALSALTAYIVNGTLIWQVAAIALLGLTVYLSLGRTGRPFLKRIAWVPFIGFIIAAALVWRGDVLAVPVVNKLNVGYSELSLPWQMTIDVAAGSLKASPLFGVGPNRFSQAFLSYKPAAINQTDVWGVEFNSGFGLIPTFLVTQGFFGGALWILFFIFFGILGVKSLRGIKRPDGLSSVIEPERPYARFVLVSSYAGAAFLWLMALVYVLPHALLFFTFLLTGIWLATSVSYGRLRSLEVLPRPGSFGSRIVYPTVTVAMLIVVAVWGISYIKNTVALAYFGSGVAQLTVANDPMAADSDFRTALAMNPLDIYWQARVEAGIADVSRLISSVASSSPASAAQAVAAQATAVINATMGYAANAIAADPDNYYNYVSEARVGEQAASLQLKNGYEVATDGYNKAIALNPGNPSLYVSLAKLQASQKDYDRSIQTIGAALQVKANYLDAVFLLSQVEAAKGNLPDAITAESFAIQLNPNAPTSYFQLGLLQYDSGNYASSTQAFAAAIALQPSYANAQYFLGLSDARLGRIADATSIFAALAVSNPDNKDVAAILAALKAGRPLFTGPTSATSAAAAAEKRSTLPVPQK